MPMMPNAEFKREWFSTVDEEISDPIVGKLIHRLGQCVNELVVRTRRGEWKHHHEAVMDICRLSQQIRLQVGSLFAMEVTAREKMQEALQVSVKLAVEDSRFKGTALEEYQEAKRNVKFRLDLSTCDDSVRQIAAAGSSDEH